MVEQGVPKNTWSVLAGDCMIEETNLEEELATEASMCVIFSNQPGGDLFANEAMLKSPFTYQFTTHLYNPGGGANLAGGNYPMMLADIKSSVMKVCHPTLSFALFYRVCRRVWQQKSRHASWQQYTRANKT